MEDDNEPKETPSNKNCKHSSTGCDSSLSQIPAKYKKTKRSFLLR